MGLWLAIGVAALTVASAWLDGDSGLRTWWALRADLVQAEARIDALKRDVVTLERTSDALEADPFAIERAIRERLGWAKAGETLVLLRPTGDATPRIP